jgi:hypothetical protein
LEETTKCCFKNAVSLNFVGRELNFVGRELNFVGRELNFVGRELNFVGRECPPSPSPQPRLILRLSA